jgi:hypothetical protein
LRYGPVRNGYHGGASAQEVVIPLALLASEELTLDGWASSHHPQPAWWFELPAEVPASQAPAPADAKTGKVSKTGKGRRPEPAAPVLFEEAQVGPAAWVERVLASEVMTARLAQRNRAAMPADKVAALLRLMGERGGIATRLAVARALDVPDSRVAGQIAAAQRVLNIDGYDVLQMEDDTVRLNIELLKIQTDTW